MPNRNPLHCTTPLLIALLSLAGMSLTFFLNFPYRPFPNDEYLTYSDVFLHADWLSSQSAILMNSPVHPYVLGAIRPLVELLGMHWSQTFLVTTVASLGGAAFFAGMTVHEATGRRLFAIGTALIFLVSAWGQAYVHCYTYGPLSALFLMASLYCFTRQFSGKCGTFRFPAAAGFLCALFLLGASSAKLLAGIVMGAYILLAWQWGREGRTRRIAWLVGAFLVPLLVLMPVYLFPLLRHLQVNLYEGNFTDCIDKYGFRPTPPVPSFAWLLGVYSPASLAFILSALAVVAVKWRRVLAAGPPGRLVVALMAIVVLHTVAIDILPFTILGRGHFPVFCLAIVGFSILCAEFPVDGQVGKWIFIIFLIVTVPLEVRASVRIREARRAAPESLERLPAGTKFYVMQEDPFQEYIAIWLGNVRLIRMADLPGLVNSSRPGHVALLIGPTGINSGKTILQESILDDFHFELPREVAAIPHEELKLPYYAYLPVFMMEEENSQCFYFRHQVPDNDDPRSGLTVEIWPPVGK